jgi:phosphoribosylaminoimidazolecarboxamide formyltransferase/IMP cyclohydrolase
MSSIKPKTALISLSDKSNLEVLVSFLISQNVKILSTGGTYKAIQKITEKS